MQTCIALVICHMTYTQQVKDVECNVACLQKVSPDFISNAHLALYCIVYCIFLYFGSIIHAVGF